MVTIRNDVHGTKISIRIKSDGELTLAQIKRARSTLCGVYGCTCGGNLLGECGRQDVEIEPIGYDAAGNLRVRVRSLDAAANDQL